MQLSCRGNCRSCVNVRNGPIHQCLPLDHTLPAKDWSQANGAHACEIEHLYYATRDPPCHCAIVVLYQPRQEQLNAPDSGHDPCDGPLTIHQHIISGLECPPSHRGQRCGCLHSHVRSSLHLVALVTSAYSLPTPAKSTSVEPRSGITRLWKRRRRRFGGR